jgi:O-antigen ligase
MLSSLPAADLSKAAPAVLVTLVVLSPWPFGSAHPRTTQAIALVTLVAALVLLIALGRRAPSSPRSVLAPLVGLWLLAGLQLVPFPQSVLEGLAPGPSAVWYPGDPVAAGVLGSGAHPLSVHPEATTRWLAFATGLGVLALLAAPALKERRALVRVAVVTVSGGVLVAVYGLLARVLFHDKLYGLLTVPTLAPFGPFVSKNHFAGYVEMAACLAVGLATGLADEAKRGPGRLLGWLDSPRAARVVFAGGAAGVLALAVPVSLSRGGTVSLAAGLVAFVLVRIATRRRAEGSRRALAVAGAALLVAGVGLALVLPPEARSRVTTLTRTQGGGPDPFRLGVWRDALRLAASSPLVGSGLGAFEDALPPFKTGAGDLRVEHAENDYVELLAEGGVAAGALAGLLIAAALVGGLRSVRDEPHRAAQGIRAGALAGVAALLVHSAFDFNLRIPSNALLFVLLVAIVLRPGPRVDEPPGAEPRRPRSRSGSRTRGGRVASGPPLSHAPLTRPRPRCARSRSSTKPASISDGGPPTPRPGSLSRGCGRRRRLRRRRRSRPGPSTSTPSTSPSDGPRSEWRALRSSRAGRSRRASRTPGRRGVASWPRATRAAREARVGSAPAGSRSEGRAARAGRRERPSAGDRAT